ncbi:MAG: class I SAM-dependent methyltransferase [Proteobacteria bacterium]|nr:class I SAM-dependent methyltransferase [Pseudomonadota bacterium]
MASSTDLAVATAEIAACMTECEACPCCGGRDLEAVACRNDLNAIDGVNDGMRDSFYHVCLDCSVIFARRRQSLASVPLFYQWFAHLERRDYAVYPPPQNYIQAKSAGARTLLGYLADRGVLSPGMTIAHVRCDAGSLLMRIREQFPDCTLHGYDYFESNIRYAHDQGLDGVGQLDAAGIKFADGTAYDLIVCNHIFTHSFDPAADLQKLYAALKPGGVLFLYNEVDHLLRFQPKGRFYQWVALNNFHKQLLSPASLEVLLTRGGFSIEDRSHRNFYMQFLARRNVATVDTSYDAAVALAAREAAPVMVRNFQRWATVQDSRFHGLIKITSKLRKALRRES